MEAQLNEVASSLAALDGRRQESSDSGEDRQAEIAAGSREVARLRAALEAAREKDASERVLLASGERDLEAARADERRTRGELEGRAGRAENARDAREACEASLSADERQLADDLEVLSACKLELDEARTAFSKADGARTEAQRALQTLSERADKLRGDMDGLADRRHRCEMQLSRVEAEMETLQKRVWEDYELSYAGALAFRTEDFKLSEADKRISQIRARVRELGAVNVGAVDEFRQTQERFDEMSAQRDDLEKARLDLMGVIGELQKNMEAQFTAQFRLLNENFQQTFVRLFGGGRAELRLDDPKDALNCPIEVVAQPPGKKLQMLSLLSGGERALTAIAILFAMLKLKPTPFCFLDEIEAALDDANIDNFAEYLRQYSRDTQFIVVTHRKGTMERCDALYGVAMEEKGVSKMVSVKLSEAV